jgi:putative ATP-binding cassette transporter
LEIYRGSVVFITGGNGCGKSTLAKIVSQHYLPISGEIYVDGQRVNSQSIAAFRNEISCIYSDYYLFTQLLSSAHLVEQVRYYLHAFDLAGKVEIDNGRFSTLKLSDGQRKRLALAIAIVEEKSLYIFDEWAADQDPRFKRVFYHEILPTLKQKNCTVIVVSHDDRYFNLADRVLTMDSGQIIGDRSGATTAAF